jgi:hypothetical protein
MIMAKKSDIEAQIAALQEELANADTDDEIWIKDDSGREIKVSGKRATSVLRRFEDLWKDDETPEEDEGEPEASAAPKDPKAAPESRPPGYFGRRK